jgi:hypothetical protein
VRQRDKTLATKDTGSKPPPKPLPEDDELITTVKRFLPDLLSSEVEGSALLMSGFFERPFRSRERVSFGALESGLLLPSEMRLASTYPRDAMREALRNAFEKSVRRERSDLFRVVYGEPQARFNYWLIEQARSTPTRQLDLLLAALNDLGVRLVLEPNGRPYLQVPLDVLTRPEDEGAPLRAMMRLFEDLLESQRR